MTRVMTVLSLLFALCACQSLPGQVPVKQLFQQAQTAYQDGNLLAAEADFLAVTQRAPAYEPAWFSLGTLYIRTGQYEAAAQVLSKATKLAPEHHQAWQHLAIVRLHQSVQTINQGKAAQLAGSTGAIALQEMESQMTDFLLIGRGHCTASATHAP